MQSEIKKSNRGGARVGAGRKRVHDSYVAITLRISPRAKDNLDAYAKANGISAQEAARRLFEALEV
jgi:hypothetical protein